MNKTIIIFLVVILLAISILAATTYFPFSKSCEISIESNNTLYRVSIIDSKKFSDFTSKIKNCNNNLLSTYTYNPEEATTQVNNAQIIFTDVPQLISIRNSNQKIEYTYVSDIFKDNLVSLYLNPTTNKPEEISLEEHVFNIFMLQLNYMFNGKQSQTNYKDQYPNFESIGLSYEAK